jgi:putative peptide zinc metalloprotease protein
MTIAADQSTAPPTPGGLWATLEQGAQAPSNSDGVWRHLAARLDERPQRQARFQPGLKGFAPAQTLDAPPAPAQTIWQALIWRAEPSNYCPYAIPDVAEEQVVEGEQTFTVIRSPRGAYLRLTPQQRELWRQMDGSVSVAQLATQAFLQFKQLIPVGELVATLRSEGFLTDPATRVYSNLNETLQANTAEGLGQRLWRFFTGQTWTIKNIDGAYATLYRSVGRFLFTTPFAMLWAFVSLAGLAAFIALLTDPDTPQIITTGALTTPLEFVVLWLALLFSFVLHESAHALAVKHYGRTLYSGGLMLYFGMPAAFVDTSDIWRSPRRARVIVSAAGPMADLLIGGLASLLVFFDAPLAATAYKLAFTCYIAALFNLNPLLELDGYFMLVDWLRLPDLRRRALAFVRGPLWEKGRGNREQGTGNREQGTGSGGQGTSAHQRKPQTLFPLPSFLFPSSFSREERIFTIYGLLAILYTGVAILFALQFWREQLSDIIAGLWNSGALLQQLIAVVLTLAVAAPLVLMIVFAGTRAAGAVLGWTLRRGYGRRPGILIGVALVVVVALTALTGVYRDTLVAAALPPLLWALAFSAIAAVRPNYRGAAIAPALDALLITTALTAIAAVVRLLSPNELLWAVVEGAGFFFLLIAGFAALLDTDLRRTPAHQLLLSAILLMGAFAVGVDALAGVQSRLPDLEPNGLVAVSLGAPAYFGAVALALLLPHLLGLADSRLFWPWLLFWAAALAETLSYIGNLSRPSATLDVLAAGLWAAAWLTHLAMLRQLELDELTWAHAPSISEAQRLTRAFQLCYAGCYRLLRTAYGSRRAQQFDDRMDILAATANWNVTLDRDNARVATAMHSLPIDEQGTRYAEILRYTVAAIEDIAGASFARRAIRSAYDALPWPEREAAGRLSFPDTPWARELSAAFDGVWARRLRLLRQVDLFLQCDDDELHALAHVLQEYTVSAGDIVLRAGESTPGVWIIEAGEVLAQCDGRPHTELHRSETIGGRELLKRIDSDATYLATVETSLLFIQADEFQAIVREQAPHAADALEAVATLRLLESVPLFTGVPRDILRSLAQIVTQHTFDARCVIVRQGKPSGMFYIIKDGQAAVVARNLNNSDNKAALIAKLGEREFFGEMELLYNTPPVAAVLAFTPLTVLALPHAAVRELITGDNTLAQRLEQISSGRLIGLRESMSAGVRGQGSGVRNDGA